MNLTVLLYRLASLTIEQVRRNALNDGLCRLRTFFDLCFELRLLVVVSLFLTYKTKRVIAFGVIHFARNASCVYPFTFKGFTNVF